MRYILFYFFNEVNSLILTERMVGSESFSYSDATFDAVPAIESAGNTSVQSIAAQVVDSSLEIEDILDGIVNQDAAEPNAGTLQKEFELVHMTGVDQEQ